MELLNATNMLAGYTMGRAPDGRESIVVVVKGTFRLPEHPGERVQPAENQVPLVFADTFTGEPGYSAVIHESDFAPIKPQCDVLVIGSAYSPGGRPAKRVTVSLTVGDLVKRFDVLGDRMWDRVLMVTSPTEPAPFVSKPIGYDFAYGGMDEAPDEPEKRDAYAPNPVGRGFYPLSQGEYRLGKLLPNCVERGTLADSPTGRYVPKSFSVVGRQFNSRYPLAGTYDDRWMENKFPDLPDDFDARYFQSAPEDQRVAYPRGGETVVLENLTPAGYVRFALPEIEVPVEFTDVRYERVEKQAVLDTVVIEPDDGRFTLIWRASHPLKRNMLEMRQVIVGRMTRAFYRARSSGKTFYPSLRHFVGSPLD